MKKIILSGLAAGIVMLIVGMLVGQLIGMMIPTLAAEYQNLNLFRPWDDPLMSLYFLYPIYVGLALAWVWDKEKLLIAAGGVIKRGVTFGLIFFLIASFPGILMSYSCNPMSLTMAVSWWVGALVQVLCAGMVYAKLNG